MLCPRRTPDLGAVLMCAVLLLAECLCSEVDSSVSQNNTRRRQQMTENYTSDSNSTHMKENQNNLLPTTKASTSLSVQVGTKVVLSCPLLPPARVLLTTWEVSSSGQPFCIKAHDAETNETADNCTDGTTGWVSRPDRSPDLQIGAVALTHDGNYSCELVTRDGNFRRESHLQVLVTPKATIFLRNSDSTVVCEAFAGKPAAQLSWSPEGDCVTKEEWHGNATVTVRSTYNYSDSNVSTVTCFVSHLTGNRNLSLDLRHDTQKSVAGTYIRYVVFPIIIILIIAGSFWFLKISGGFRKCKLKKRKTTPVVEEDEMQPYASYTEKNNPLYDTINQVDFPAATK